MKCGAGFKIQPPKSLGSIENEGGVRAFRREKNMGQPIDFEIPNNRSALITRSSRELSARPTGIETVVRNIGPVRFVATDRQLTPRWESGNVMRPTDVMTPCPLMTPRGDLLI